ncbi:MAG: hypothetical protein WCI97_12150 [Bacteroidota bacterium]
MQRSVNIINSFRIIPLSSVNIADGFRKFSEVSVNNNRFLRAIPSQSVNIADGRRKSAEVLIRTASGFGNKNIFVTRNAAINNATDASLRRISSS